MDSKKFEMVAKTFQGLEDVLAEELRALGAEQVEPGRRMVSFRGDMRLLYKANLCLRTALRILKPIAKFSASNPDELYDFVRDFDWDQFLSPDKTFAIDSTVNSSEFTHSKFVTYRVKDGIVDYFSDKYHSRPSIRLSGADVQLNVHILGERVTISLDSSGEPLSKRGYRTVQTEAPLNEALAAGILLKTGWDGSCDLVDPMCGSGTFLIEAALIAANINPGIFRSGFAFETWPDFDRDLFEELYNDDSEERTPHCRIYGGDIAREAVTIATKNIKSAGVDNFVSVECKSIDEWTEPPLDAMLITNPPYGERLRPEDIEGLYRRIGYDLKHYFQGYHAWILGYKDEHFRQIGLKASVKYPILNGKLECELREYVLFDGSYASFREQGGSVGNDDFSRAEKPRMKHLSDDEWRKETRDFARSEKYSLKRRKDEKRDFKSDRREADRRGHNHKPGGFKAEKSGGYKTDNKGPRKGGKFSKPFRKSDDSKGYDAGKNITLNSDKAPKISADSEVRFASNAGPVMRSRKAWKKQ